MRNLGRKEGKLLLSKKDKDNQNEECMLLKQM